MKTQGRTSTKMPVSVEPKTGRTLDRAGICIVAVFVGWIFLSASLTGGTARPTVSLLLASALIAMVARRIAFSNRLIVPAVIVAAGVAMMLDSRLNILSRSPLGGPVFGNAAASFFMLAGIAGLMLWAESRKPAVRLVGILAAGVFSMVPLFTGSLAATSLLFTFPATALTARRLRGGRLAITSCVGLFVLGLATTIILGLSYSRHDRSGAVDRAVDLTLNRVRPALWHEALVIMVQHPLSGAGPGRFQLASPIAQTDRDLRWAHNEFLQQGAECGFVGFTLLTILFLWGFTRLLVSRASDTVAALGAAALAALGVHACIDYVLHLPVVPLCAAALFGTVSQERSGVDISPSRRATQQIGRSDQTLTRSDFGSIE